MTKPKLLFVQYRYDKKLPPFLLIHKQEHVVALAHSFDVVVVDQDANYQALCDRHRPDLALFESGVNHPSCRRPRITGVKHDSSIPKIGLHHADAFCNARAAFMWDMEALGIDTCFAIATAAGEHTPQLCEQLFYWPVFIDPFVFRDHGEPKRMQVLLTGNQSSTYPWRRSVFPRLRDNFGHEALAHPGYFPQKRFERLLVGIPYARSLAAATFVPSCGTVAREFVRKHLEIPAVGSCLIAERSPALEAAGFVDMENCVFADAADVVDKVESLIRDPDRLAEVVAQGHRLVHQRHTDRHRQQVRAWFDAQAMQRADQKMVQLDPFAAPELVAVSSSSRTLHLQAQGAHLIALASGDSELARGNFEAAAEHFRDGLSFIHWMPEPKVGLARCCLLAGDPAGAETWLDELLTFTLATCRAAQPDSVEWALAVLIALCRGDRSGARRRASAYPLCAGIELERARWLVDLAWGEADANPRWHACPETPNRRSLHPVDGRTFPQWQWEVTRMLRACGQAELADALRSSAPYATLNPSFRFAAVVGSSVVGPGVPGSQRPVPMSVSVLIPTFNRADVLARAIDSALAQTRAPGEIIVIDDGSTDATSAVLQRYGARVRCIRTTNRGVAAARDRAVREATGRWIAFLDSDDHWTTSHLDGILRVVQATDSVAAWYFGDAILDAQGSSFWQQCDFGIGPAGHAFDHTAQWAFRAMQPVLLQASLISRAAILEAGGFLPHLQTREDTLLFFRIALSASVCAVALRSTVLGHEADNRLTTVLAPQTETYLRCTVALYRQVLTATRAPASAPYHAIASRRLRAACAALVARQCRRLRIADAARTVCDGLRHGGPALFATFATKGVGAVTEALVRRRRKPPASAKANVGLVAGARRP